jgi:hypothetical protein
MWRVRSNNRLRLLATRESSLTRKHYWWIRRSACSPLGFKRPRPAPRQIATQSWRDYSFIPVLSITRGGDALALDYKHARRRATFLGAESLS